MHGLLAFIVVLGIGAGALEWSAPGCLNMAATVTAKIYTDPFVLQHLEAAIAAHNR